MDRRARTDRLSLTAVRTEGAILPPSVLKRIHSEDPKLQGIKADDYGLSGERVREAASRAWNALQAPWRAFSAERARVAPETEATGMTRTKWLNQILKALDYGSLDVARTKFTVGVREFPISHLYSRVPMHLVGCGIDLDKKTPGAPGAAKMTPHGLVQLFLNGSDAHLWGIVSNGLVWRILRDSLSLSRQAMVEFNLEAIFDGQLYDEFLLFYMLCHQSRLKSDRPEECWLERWSQTAGEEGTRALNTLRDGVKDAIELFGQGFLRHPANTALQAKIRADDLTKQDYYRELLRLVYRLLFLFVAEDRSLLLHPEASDEAQRVYADYYSTQRLRALAERLSGSDRHADLYMQLKLVFTKLGEPEGCPELGLPALGGFLFNSTSLANLDAAEIFNRDLLEAIRKLAVTKESGRSARVDYKNLDTVEFGSVYESLLELHPDLASDGSRFALLSVAGNERKATGSHYTPDSLVQCLLDSALDPVVNDAVRDAGKHFKSIGEEPPAAQAILALKVCDPAVGSGHFLIGAAHRMAKRLASVRSGDEEPPPGATRTALRDIIGRCLYGVDINPMAVELCKVALWMEALEPGKPLSFLDHHIQCGNSLLGTTPALLNAGIPDAAFEAIEGDDKAVCAGFKKKNKLEREGQGELFDANLHPWEQRGNLTTALAQIGAVADDTLAGAQQRQTQYEQLVRSQSYEDGRLLADAWCAAFVWKKQRTDGAYPLTNSHLKRILRNPHDIEPWMRDEIKRLAAQYQFFHWHLSFPGVFQTTGTSTSPTNVNEATQGLTGGFDAMLGNPPWERVKLQEKEWFAARCPDIAKAPYAAQRQLLIAALKSEKPVLHSAFLSDRRQAEGESHLLGDSGLYPLCGRGDVNTFAVFSELFRILISVTGRAGLIVPSGIATDDTTKDFFASLTDTATLASLYSFHEIRRFFLATDSRIPFCILTLRGTMRPEVKKPAEFVFSARTVQEVSNPEKRFTLTAEDIALLNPNTQTCPVFQFRRDAEITRDIYRRIPIFVREGNPGSNPWGTSFMAMLHMSNDSNLFRGEPDTDRLPLYEAKMVATYDHRAADVVISETAVARQGQSDVLDCTAHTDPHRTPVPRYWVDKEEVESRLQKRDRQGNTIWSWQRKWLLGWREITNNAGEHTVIASLLPRVAVGNKFLLIFPANDNPIAAACLVANFSTVVLDYSARQKFGGTSLSYFIFRQLPVLTPMTYVSCAPAFTASNKVCAEWILPRVLELIYSAWDMQHYAHDCGYYDPPFAWNEDRRFLLRCELDAAYFHLYGIERDDVDYIMETFPIVKRKDEAAHGEFRTKRVILEIYDEMKVAMETGIPYQTRLDPPPANGWTPSEELIKEAFATHATDAAARHTPNAIREEPADLELVPPPSLPTPLRDKAGEVYRLRVFDGSDQEVLKAGVAVGKNRQGDVTCWTIQPDGETAAKEFVCPPMVVKRLRGKG